MAVDTAARAWARHELDEVDARLREKEEFIDDLIEHVAQARESLRQAEDVLRRADREARGE